MRRLLVLVAAATVFATAATPASGLPPVRHVFVIVLENKGVFDAFGPGAWIQAPYLSRELPAKGQFLARYYGVGHNSASNYVAMLSGQPPNPSTKAACPDPLGSTGPDAVAPYNLAKGDG